MKSLPQASQAFEEKTKAFPAPDQSLLRVALSVAWQQHEGQLKFSIYPYLIHPIEIALYLIDRIQCKDTSVIIAALLHDCVEDGAITIDAISEQFGETVAKLVQSETRRVDHTETEDEKEIAKREFFNRVVLHATPDAQLIGCCDKLNNIQNAILVENGNPHYQKLQRWMREAEDFLPLAKKLNTVLYSDLAGAIAALGAHIHESDAQKPN